MRYAYYVDKDEKVRGVFVNCDTNSPDFKGMKKIKLNKRDSELDANYLRNKQMAEGSEE